MGIGSFSNHTNNNKDGDDGGSGPREEVTLQLFGTVRVMDRHGRDYIERLGRTVLARSLAPSLPGCQDTGSKGTTILGLSNQSRAPAESLQWPLDLFLCVCVCHWCVEYVTQLIRTIPGCAHVQPEESGLEMITTITTNHFCGLPIQSTHTHTHTNVMVDNLESVSGEL